MSVQIEETTTYSVSCPCGWSVPNVVLSRTFAEKAAADHDATHDPDAIYERLAEAPDREYDGIPLGFGEPEDG